jgi:hypothetical protein
MKEIRNNLCPFICLEVYGQRHAMLMKSTSKGCANRALLRVGEKEINGKEADLSQMAFDVTQWTDVQLSVSDKQVTININGKECFFNQLFKQFKTNYRIIIYFKWPV